MSKTNTKVSGLASLPPLFFYSTHLIFIVNFFSGLPPPLLFIVKIFTTRSLSIHFPSFPQRSHNLLKKKWDMSQAVYNILSIGKLWMTPKKVALPSFFLIGLHSTLYYLTIWDLKTKLSLYLILNPKSNPSDQ